MDFIVAGTGWAGEAHVWAIQALAEAGVECEVSALVDVDAEHLGRVSDEWGVPEKYTDLETALSECQADAVILATPHHLHRQGTQLAAARGRHVLVEKPMALTLEDADAMIEACDGAGVLRLGRTVSWADVGGVVRCRWPSSPLRPPVGGAGPRGEEGLWWQETERMERFVTDSQ